MREKLVRDRVPEILAANGGKPVFRKALEQEQMLWIIKKLVEEVIEVVEAETKDGRLEEFADLQEVLNRAIMLQVARMGLTYADFMALMLKKRQEKGAFDEDFILGDICEPSS